MRTGRALAAIVRREIGGFFHAPMAPVLVGGFLLLVGVAFDNILLDYSSLSLSALESGRTVGAALNLTDGVVRPLVSNILLLLTLLMPAVTMRLFAEEYRSGRADLLMSYPVPDHVWVGGKYLGALAVAGVLLAATAVHGVVIVLLGGPEPGPLAAAMLALVLAAALAAAWGLFFSALVTYQLVAYVLAFGFLTLLMMVDNLLPHLPGPLASLGGHLSLPAHFLRLSRGVVDSRDLVFFLGWTAVGLLGTSAAVAGRRLAGGRAVARWTPPLLMLVLLAMLTAIAERAPVRTDLTSNRRFSLAPQTCQVLDALDRDVTLTAFYQRLDPRRKAAEDLLASLRDRSRRISYRIVDPDRHPALVKDLGVTVARTVVVQAGDRRRELLDPDEGALINAVFRVVSGEQPVVYFLSGHGERDIASRDRPGFAACDAALRRQGYIVRPLLLAERAEVPGDAAAVVLASPTRDPSPAELRALTAYVARGGSVLALVDPGTPAGLADWLASYNVVVGEDFLVSADGAARQFGMDRQVLAVLEYGPHEITRSLGGMFTFYPYAQSLRPRHGQVAGLTARTLVASGERSWSEHDLDSVRRRQPRFDEGVDEPGPFPVAVAVEIDLDRFRRRATADTSVTSGGDLAVGADAGGLAPSVFRRERTARLVVVGDADFASNAYINLYGDRDLLLNIVGWLAREETLVAVRARETLSQPVVLTTTWKRWLAWGGVAGWPLAMTVLSVLVVVRRRRVA